MEEIAASAQDHPLLEVLLANLTAALDRLTGASWKASAGEAAAPEQGLAQTAIMVALRGALHGTLHARAVAEEIEAVVEAEEDAASPAIRWIRESIERWRSSRSESPFEAEISEGAPEPMDGQSWTVRFESADGRQVVLQLACDEELSASFPRPDAKGPSDAEASEKPRVEAMNLELVLDVELDVVLRFGQRQLSLREVLDLTSGSVIELDRQVEEPVELLLDGKVIARGEAVVIDGNYGLRVTEVPLPISQSMLPSA